MLALSLFLNNGGTFAEALNETEIPANETVIESPLTDEFPDEAETNGEAPDADGEYTVEETGKKAEAFGHELSSISTSYVKGNSNRNYNMQLACDSINGMIIDPGESFSYNKTILSASNNGRDYKVAGILINGESSDGIGGGICQVSSTLFVASLYSGMTITERHSHSAKIGYLKAGMDATVSWGGPDFRFKNNLLIPVKIEAKMDNGLMTIRFLSEDPLYLNIKIDVEGGGYSYTLTRYIDGKAEYVTKSRYQEPKEKTDA